MTKCPSKWPNLWNRVGRNGSNDDQISFKEIKFVKQNWTQRVKWWPNLLQRDQICETELDAKGQMMTKSPSKGQICETELDAKGQMMTKCPSKRPILWDRSVRIGSNDDEITFKESKFVKQNWTHWVKWWPNVFQRDQICETELVSMGQMMTKCPWKRPNLWDRIGCNGSNDDQMFFKETKFIR